MVTVKFFAVMKKMVGRENLTVPLDSQLPLRDFLSLLETDLPNLRSVIQGGKILISVNQEMATDETVITDGDEIAMLPPFAGGSGAEVDAR